MELYNKLDFQKKLGQTQGGFKIRKVGKNARRRNCFLDTTKSILLIYVMLAYSYLQPEFFLAKKWHKIYKVKYLVHFKVQTFILTNRPISSFPVSLHSIDFFIYIQSFISLWGVSLKYLVLCKKLHYEKRK